MLTGYRATTWQPSRLDYRNLQVRLRPKTRIGNSEGVTEVTGRVALQAAQVLQQNNIFTYLIEKAGVLFEVNPES